MWNRTKFEKHIEDRLLTELDENAARHLLADFDLARDKLVHNIFREIAGVEPNLSDHGPDHIANVLENARYLVSEDHRQHGLSAMDLYLLGMAILFHDVGNLFGREDHHRKIGEIFDWARGTDAAVKREKTLVLKAARAHTGTASDGTRDTLKEVPESDQLQGQRVQLRSIAAILRFADELAEGPQRTSEFRRREGLYSVDSRIYQDYASITHVAADRGTGRILLTYELEIESGGTASIERSERLRQLLGFAYERAVKLDQERRYARYYCDALSAFKLTEIAFNFHCGGRLLPLDLPPLRLDDKVVPGESTRSIPEHDPRYGIDRLARDLIALAEQRTEA